jgi:hypothetical protein
MAFPRSLKLEKSKLADQLDHPALVLIANRPDVFSSQGHIAAGYRRRDGKTFGPYYRLSYRDQGRQHSVYLGRSGPLLDRIRQALATIQKSLSQHRLLNRLERQVRASLRGQKSRLAALLRPTGLTLKGFEIRGWRLSPIRRLMPFRAPSLKQFSIRMPTLDSKTASHWPKQPVSKRPFSAFLHQPAARLMRFLMDRDGPDALKNLKDHSCIPRHPCRNANDDFVARLMGFGPGWRGLVP